MPHSICPVSSYNLRVLFLCHLSVVGQYDSYSRRALSEPETLWLNSSCPTYLKKAAKGLSSKCVRAYLFFVRDSGILPLCLLSSLDLVFDDTPILGRSEGWPSLANLFIDGLKIESSQFGASIDCSFTFAQSWIGFSLFQLYIKSQSVCRQSVSFCLFLQKNWCFWA